MGSPTLLTQEEVEALLELVESERGAVPAGDGAAEAPEPAAVSRRDFSKPGRLPRADYRWFQGEASHAATRLGEALGRWLQMEVRAECVSIEIQQYQGFLGALPSPCLVFPIRLAGDQAGALSLDSAAVLAAVDRVLGGTGKARFVSRAVTSVEVPIAQKFAGCALEAFADGLADVATLERTPAGPPTVHVRQARYLPSETKCLVLSYTVAGDLAETELKLVFPASLFPRRHVAGETTERPAAPPPAIPSVGVEVAVRLGDTSIGLRDLLALEAGDVVSLDTDLGEPATLEVEGRPVATASVGTLDGSLAVQVDHLLPHAAKPAPNTTKTESQP